MPSMHFGTFLLPYFSKFVENIYLNLLRGPNSKIAYTFVMLLTIISYPAFSPLWYPFVYKLIRRL